MVLVEDTEDFRAVVFDIDEVVYQEFVPQRSQHF
jgi:hypothetical protein